MRLRFPQAERGVEKWRRLLLACASGVLLVWAGPTAAQQGADTDALAVTLLTHLRGELPAGRAAVDPEPFCTPRLVGWRCAAPVRAAADALGFSLHSREFTLICTGGQGSCRLIGVRSLVSFENLEIDARGSRAGVTASLWWRTGQGMSPVSYRQRRITLARGRNGWAVTDAGR